MMQLGLGVQKGLSQVAALKLNSGEFPGSPVVKTPHLTLQRAQVLPLVRELRF